MKIEHIVDRNWALYWYKENKGTNTYDLRIYRLKKDSSYGYRYILVFHEKNYYMDILATDSKEEMMMTLDLMGLRIDQVNIFIMENLNRSITVQFSVIDLIEK